MNTWLVHWRASEHVWANMCSHIHVGAHRTPDTEARFCSSLLTVETWKLKPRLKDFPSFIPFFLSLLLLKHTNKQDLQRLIQWLPSLWLRRGPLTELYFWECYVTVTVFICSHTFSNVLWLNRRAEKGPLRSWKFVVCLCPSGLVYVWDSNGRNKASCNGSESCSVVSNSLWPHGLYSPWNSLGQNTGVGSLSLLQGIFPTH